MKLKYLIIHCTDTPEGRVVTKHDIETWHLGPKPDGRGWSKVGYSDMINLEGELINLIPFDQDDEVDSFEISNGARGMNSKSRHVVYVGGQEKDTRAPKDTKTIQQIEALTTYIKYTVLRHPDIKIAGHYHFSDKGCPNFDVTHFCRSIGIDDKNII